VSLAVPCGLILNELASNALKHAFRDRPAGEVTFGLTHDAKTAQVCLRVSDNGAGLPAGLDWRQSRSLGLRLVQMLAQQLGGTVEAGNGPGTEFRLTFVISKEA
jgi:two-component sensor histidine kinase